MYNTVLGRAGACVTMPQWFSHDSRARMHFCRPFFASSSSHGSPCLAPTMTAEKLYETQVNKGPPSSEGIPPPALAAPGPTSGRRIPVPVLLRRLLIATLLLWPGFFYASRFVREISQELDVQQGYWLTQAFRTENVHHKYTGDHRVPFGKLAEDEFLYVPTAYISCEF